MTGLLTAGELPPGFSYPEPFLRVVRLGLTNLEPWQVLDGHLLRRHQQGVGTRYPDRRLVVFARRGDNDDLACWDLDRGPGRVSVIHDFAAPGWEQRADLPGFDAWLRRAVEDLLAFE